MRVCTKCGVVKNSGEFFFVKGKNRPAYWCRDCHRTSCREFKQRDRDKSRYCALRYEARRLGYAIPSFSLDELRALRRNHDGVCDMTGCSSPATSIDHGHILGEFRGFLCNGCNSGLGFFRDSPTLLRAAAEYLERSRCSDK